MKKIQKAEACFEQSHKTINDINAKTSIINTK